MYAAMRSPRFNRRRRNPAPILIFAIIFLMVGCWILNATCSKEKGVVTPSEEFKRYVEEVTPSIERSNDINRRRRELLGNLAALMPDKEGLESSLKSLVDECREVREGLFAVQPPSDLEVADASLKICADRRFRAMEKYRADLINVLFESMDTAVFVKNISEEMTELIYADGDYQYFRLKVTDLLREKGMADVAVPESRWMESMGEADVRNIENFIRSMRGTEVHGVALGKVSLDPQGRLAVEQGESVFYLPYTSELRVTVPVENQGNRPENGIPVVLTYYSSKDSSPRKLQKEIGALQPGETAEVVFEGIVPESGGVRNVLEIMAGPVPWEQNTDNNKKIIYYKVE